MKTTVHDGQYAGTVRRLLNLILTDVRILAEDAAKAHRMDPDTAGIDNPGIRAALHFANATATRRIRIWPRIDDQRVSQFISNQWHHASIEFGDEDLFGAREISRRAVAGVHGFKNQEILRECHAAK